ncbi:glutamate-5-semialdehyde dehydrogenase [Candidatus Falkowbacteria bacterium]|nr:glutamate-5-semialdehyde dehydrogenase [Candidatus Falkowbacteria bacterium]
MDKKLKDKLIKVKKSSQKLGLIDIKKRNNFLNILLRELIKKTNEIIQVNKKDTKKMSADNPMIDRLKLDKKRIKSIASDIKKISSLPDPLKETIEKRTLKNGLILTKKRVPLGVVGVIYESRPNVTCDVVSLCLKSGNAVILKGGKESDATNKFLVKIIKDSLKKSSLPIDSVFYIDAKNKNLLAQLFKANNFIDVIIPRGGQGLINFIRQNSQVPVIETGAGVCHTYIDKNANTEMALKIAYNAKTTRPSVCNALDTLLINKTQAEKTLKQFYLVFNKSDVLVYADSKSYKILQNLGFTNLKKAKEKSFGKEFLSLKMSVKIVADIQEAINHINKFGSGHSESIISKNKNAINKFQNQINAACVYSNASTRFTDGSEFGLGGEIGISTQKLHARGPMGLKELTTYKWIIQGKGQIRI